MDSFNAELHADEITQPTAQDWAEYHAWLDAKDESSIDHFDPYGEWVDEYADDHDGQPDEYTEWQDYMGGDDWDHGQYDCDY